jgi:hypothetical protein
MIRERDRMLGMAILPLIRNVRLVLNSGLAAAAFRRSALSFGCWRRMENLTGY